MSFCTVATSPCIAALATAGVREGATGRETFVRVSFCCAKAWALATSSSEALKRLIRFMLTSSSEAESEFARAIAETHRVVDAEPVHQAEHHVRHRRSVGRLEVEVATEVAAM